MSTIQNGTWKFIQRWSDSSHYSFKATLINGTLTINDGEFFGTYTALDGANPGQIAIAIADFNNRTITSYVGNYQGNLMGGQMVGAPDNGSATPKGVWSAFHISILEIDEGSYGIEV
ncbi:hypothetical protein SIO70_07765 [Chitinophaga sancti]|uniref:hypothetical protein n=1 Tax=Chitinophaga sancti TaxID=1004 RepID=UPI002A750F89|nr:hypothetical protein [Chitinophaga sancti]WPQ64763.1 hypothetical protein SIO70_07765 [Chitinophaga sancti]